MLYFADEKARKYYRNPHLQLSQLEVAIVWSQISNSLTHPPPEISPQPNKAYDSKTDEIRLEKIIQNEEKQINPLNQNPKTNIRINEHSIEI